MYHPCAICGKLVDENHRVDLYLAGHTYIKMSRHFCPRCAMDLKPLIDSAISLLRNTDRLRFPPKDKDE